MPLSRASAWQDRRTAFSHGWLRGRFLPRLGTYQSLLEGHASDYDREHRFDELLLGDWRSHETEILELLAEMEAALSPRALLEDGPLSRCDETTKEWLGEVAHYLWLARCSIPRRLTNAHEALADARAAATRLETHYVRLQRPVTAAGLAPLTADLARFRAACKALGRAVSDLPDKVMVV